MNTDWLGQESKSPILLPQGRTGFVLPFTFQSSPGIWAEGWSHSCIAPSPPPSCCFASSPSSSKVSSMSKSQGTQIPNQVVLLKSNDIFHTSFHLVPTVASKVALMISTSDIRKWKLREIRGHAQCCSGDVDELGFKAGLSSTLHFLLNPLACLPKHSWSRPMCPWEWIWSNERFLSCWIRHNWVLNKQ